MAIIISENKQNAQWIDQSKFDDENELQKYIYDNPESLPMNDIKEDIQLLILAREFSTKSGPIDAIGFDKDGEIYIVETKLYKNPDKRLVVAQVLDYGASLWQTYSDFGRFRNTLEDHVSKHFKVNLISKLKEYFGCDDDEVESLLGNVEQNLSDGNFRFVVLMDKLHDQLKDLIVFLNQNSRFDIFGVELEYYKFQDYEILIPKVFGAEVKKEVRSSNSSRRTWNEDSFFDAVRQNLNVDVQKATQKVYDFCVEHADDITWGTGNNGSFNPKFYNVSRRSIFGISTGGWLQINFGWLNDDENTVQIREKLKVGIENIGLMDLPDDVYGKFPTVSLEVALPKLDEFLEMIKRLVTDCNEI